MTEVVFYILNSNDDAAKDHFTCKLLNKIYSEQRQADLLCMDDQQAQRLDLNLWAFKPQAFIPHAIAHQMPAPIQIFADQVESSCQDVLLNLHSQLPSDWQSYQRVIEVLDQSPELIQLGRDRFKYYRSLEIEPTVHKIGFE